MLSAAFRLRLLLSELSTQTSLGTTRFLLSIYLPHLSCTIPCSYWASTWMAALPSYITSYVISVRQTRDLPIGSYFPHIRLPSDSTSRWTPLPSAISFPLPGGFETCTRWKRAPPGAQYKNLLTCVVRRFYNRKANFPKRILKTFQFGGYTCPLFFLISDIQQTAMFFTKYLTYA